MSIIKDIASQLAESLERAYQKIRSFDEAYVPAMDFGRDVDLKNWNVIQGLLWKVLCTERGWDRNDGVKFQTFGRFFFHYWQENHTIPDLEDVPLAL